MDTAKAKRAADNARYVRTLLDDRDIYWTVQDQAAGILLRTLLGGVTWNKKQS